MTTPTTQSLPIGSTLQGGKYRITRELGHGGFGITYLALQVALNRQVAIKEFFMREFCNREVGTSAVTVASEGSRDTIGRFRTKFVKEAQMIAGLDNPHVIRIHDIFEENGTAYYVMEYIDGGSLGDLVKSHGPLDEATALGYIRQIGDALAYLHSCNILHLDIKPSNVLLRKGRRGTEAVLIDFGISKHYDEAGGQTSTTPTGRSRGYAPIEQYKQGGLNQFAPSTDIYSLGATLYKLLTGETPPDATDLIDDDLEFPASVSPTLQTVIAKAMASSRKRRYQQVDDFLSAIDRKVAIPVVPEVVPTPKVNTEETVVARPKHKADHEWVDLGLSVLWATCNVGANSPEERGDYFAWGETMPKSEYTNKNSKTYGDSSYNRDIGGDASTDAARANWGGTWRLPTEVEFLELLDDCTWTWTTQGGHNGYKVTSKKKGYEGRSIFLPAAGWRYGSSLFYAGEDGRYWSSSPDGSNSYGARGLNVYSSGHGTGWDSRSYGRSVRPVSE